MRPRRHALLLAVLLLPAPLLTAQPALVSDRVQGAGRFDFALEGAAIVLDVHAGIVAQARSAQARLVDDRREYAVPHPLGEGDLVSFANRTVRSVGATDAHIRVTPRPGQEPVAILLPARLRAAVDGVVSVRPQAAQVLDRSHFVTSQAVGADAYQYEILQPESLLVHAEGSVAFGPDGAATLYLWGCDVVIDSASGTRAEVTGTYEDDPVSEGKLRVRHFVHAFIEIDAASWSFAAARLLAQRAQVASIGTLGFANATRQADGAPAAAVDLTTVDGTFLLEPSAGRLAASPVGGTVAFPGDGAGRFGWLVVPALLLAAAGVVAAPSVAGAWLERRGDMTPASGGARRAAVYARWAALAEGRGRDRLAALLAGRAVRCRPQLPEYRVEHAMLLRQAGRPAAALAEHTRAASLLAWSPDPGVLALNAYGASACCVALGRIAEGLEWLHAAVHRDAGLRATAAADPALRPLRALPEYDALVGS